MGVGLSPYDAGRPRAADGRDGEPSRGRSGPLCPRPAPPAHLPVRVEQPDELDDKRDGPRPSDGLGARAGPPRRGRRARAAHARGSRCATSSQTPDRRSRRCQAGVENGRGRDPVARRAGRAGRPISTLPSVTCGRWSSQVRYGPRKSVSWSKAAAGLGPGWPCGRVAGAAGVAPGGAACRGGWRRVGT